MSHHKVKITPKPRESDKRILHQFCENTSLHGLKYIFEDGSLLFERYVFLLFFSISRRVSVYFSWWFHVLYLQASMDVGVFIGHLFLRLFLLADVAKVGRISNNHIG